MKTSQLMQQENFKNSIATKIKNGFTLVEKNDKLPFAILAKEEKRVDHGVNFLIFEL